MQALLILNLNLDFYILDSKKLKLQATIKPTETNSHLELAQRLEVFWGKNWKTLSQAKEIYFLIGSKAGFTDTRMVIIWLKSLHFFYPQISYYTIKTKQNISTNLDLQTLLPLLDFAKDNQDNQIIYSKEPRIG